MRKLYVDKFRGFDATWIPLEDVNFLVGENSTGKTSIMSLIQILGSFEYWFHQQFNNDLVELGSFRDILSAKDSSARSFSVGMIECQPDGSPSADRHVAFLMIYEQSRGMPRLTEWSFVSSSSQIRVSFRGKTARYTIEPLAVGRDLPNSLDATFATWLEHPIGDASGYSRLSSREVPLSRPILVSDVLRTRAGGDRGKGDARLSRPMAYPGPSFSLGDVWMAPVRSKPERIYSGISVGYSPEGEHTPHTVSRILSGRVAAAKFRDYIGAFGSDSHLMEGVYVRKFGRTPNSPFELGVSLGGAQIPISDVGYGVSQALPILVELYTHAGGDRGLMLLQQPEVHLHPRAQAALGQVIHDMAQEHGHRFLVETHSDYLIDRYRICRRESADAPKPSSQVLFFERDGLGNRVHVIPITEQGEYSDQQPDGFRGFFIDEQLRLLGL